MNSVATFTDDSLSPYISKESGALTISLFIKGMKCSHCVHKISKMLNKSTGVLDYHIDLATQNLEIKSQVIRTFVGLIDQINQLGFDAIPLAVSNESQVRREAVRQDLKRMAVAGVCAGNSMLFATAVYLGADASFKTFFHWLSFLLVIPVLIYSAQDIFKGLFQSLKSQKFNLDVPIGLSLAMGFVMSLVSLSGNQEHIYFDSLSVVVFIILTSRFLLNNYFRSLVSLNILQFIPGVYQGRALLNGEEVILPMSKIQVGQKIVVYPGESIPVDGILESKEVLVDESVLTGESRAITKTFGDKIFAGTTCKDAKLILRATQIGKTTRVGAMISQALESENRSDEEVYAWISLFTYFVVISSGVVAAYFAMQGLWSVAFKRSFAMILIACPCAVSFGIPLIRSFLGQKARANGIIIKNPAQLKTLKNIKHIVFDKTGTLTHGTPDIDKSSFELLSLENQIKLISLELQMDHPISNGFRKIRLPGVALLPVKDFKYMPGIGIAGEIDGESWRVESAIEDHQKILKVFIDDRFLTNIKVKTGKKDKLKDIFQYLSNLNKKISIFSGDLLAEVEKITQWVPKKSHGIFLSQATPELKQQTLSKLQGGTLMVGDGYNDIAALQVADFSVSMPGALENNLKMADISLVNGNLEKIKEIFELSQLMRLTETRLFVFTSFYNSLCLTLASLGYVSPLAAAILMPVSTLSVFILIQFTMRGN